MAQAVAQSSPSEEYDRRPCNPTPLQCRCHLCHLPERTQPVSAYLRKKRRCLRESVPSRYPWRRRQADLSSFSFGCYHTLLPLTARSTNQRHLLHVPGSLAGTCSLFIQLAGRILYRRHVSGVRNLNRNTHTLSFNSGDETWVQHRGHIPKQRRLCAVRKSSNQDGKPVVQLDMEVQRSCLDKILPLALSALTRLTSSRLK